jgi:hypothetical protein
MSQSWLEKQGRERALQRRLVQYNDVLLTHSNSKFFTEAHDVDIGIPPKTLERGLFSEQENNKEGNTSLITSI